MFQNTQHMTIKYSSYCIIYLILKSNSFLLGRIISQPKNEVKIKVP